MVNTYRQLYNKEIATEFDEYADYTNYGKVIVISTKTIKYALNVAETIIPMTFFTLSILGEVLYRKLGNIELKRVVIRE